ncbi:Type I site-specific restriction-modification system, R (restriction) subunit and related helicase [Methylobacterium tarhaniae]|uniref:Type I site-specific restriction-modification system, R (Restriction) subunit and related helicase n=1 Tax=Methylobacterium tarhaniae TaxID=1187852 RepID=A0A0J6TCL1_9HYPH|nr:type I restriction endonuclease [Methylobacterium tarhaniae]KMO43594.1 Type I site-specific restriction-modification system, R (restriction) subunit and related helicase [Methylobacterium tarhaniae]
MNLHKEISFEDEICGHLAAHGWIYERGASTHYDRQRALFPADLTAWVQQTQPKAWEALGRSHGASAAAALLDRVRKQIGDRGTLDIIRHGVDMVGVKGRIALAQFRPAIGMNPDINAAYRANRLRVVRQLRYSLANENSIDVVLLLNGVPVATLELKTNFTQSVSDAIDQYRFDRLPQPKGQAREPLLSFPGGALVHFAVSNSEVYMTTKLAGPATRFLPFNKGDHGAAGNPTNPNGHRTGYLWEEVLERESWLEILGRYFVAQRDAKSSITDLIFPRYHQLDATRRLATAVRSEGPGGKYLIQHSAGSGKTNSIAWAAHFLADLHDEADKKLFSTVIVVSDRNVIDSQLQDALFGFARTTGVVATIRSEGGAKSGQLAEALAQGKKIIVCTIQTFPFALDAVRELAATEGKRFAVIADEAHSSQTGEAAKKLKQLLSPQEIADLQDGGEMSAEDILAAQMAARAGESGVTYIAFTATPKAKTLELFGRRPHPDQPPGPANLPGAFHVYSMRQAIEEGFILDVLRNYTPYKLAFRLANDGQDWEQQEVERSAALKGIMRWVRLHPYNISKKVEIVVEHYRENVQQLLQGKAKAMVVLGSRKEAVRWKLAIDSYIKSKGYGIGTLVAFSGSVPDPESGSEEFVESSAILNPGLKGRDIREAFATTSFHLLLVANKFQTGFDQPLLCGMYVDRRLAGIQAVQTLARLNRAHPGKDTTYVLDFLNSSDEILTAFRTYYDTAELEGVTDPDIVLDLKAKLDSSGHYDEFEVDRVIAIEMNPKSKQGELVAAIEPVADRLLKRFKAVQERLHRAQDEEDEEIASEAQDELETLALFKSDMTAYQSAYSFLSQIFDYANTDIEKRFLFYKRLLPLLEFGREREGVDLSKVMLTHHNLKSEGQRRLDVGGRDEMKLTPMTGMGSGSVQEKERALLADIIARVNDLFGGDTTDGDQLSYVTALRDKMLESETLMTQAANNTKAQFDNSPTLAAELMSAIIDAFEAHTSLSKQALDSQKVRDGLREVLLGPAQLYETLRARAEGRADA